MNREVNVSKILKEYIGDKKIVLFGAGQRGREVLEIINNEKLGEVTCFIDNKVKQKEISSILIYGIEELLKLDRKSYIIVICTNNSKVYSEINKQLVALNFNEYENFISSSILKSESISDENNPYEDIYPEATYAPWLKDYQFIECFKKVKENTLVDVYRCYELWHLVKQVSKLNEGIILEVGVWRGGTGVLMGKNASLLGIKENVYLCDTFSGVVKATEIDCSYNGGEHSDTSDKYVINLIEKNNLSNITILKGIFPDDTQYYIDKEKIRLCHIDVDVYQSAKDIFYFAWKRLVTGGVVVFDDFGFKNCNGITTLVEEIGGREDILLIQNLNGHAIFIKIK